MLACPCRHACRSTMRPAPHGRTRANSCDLSDSSRKPVSASFQLLNRETVRHSGYQVPPELTCSVSRKASFRKLSTRASEELAVQLVSLKDSVLSSKERW